MQEKKEELINLKCEDCAVDYQKPAEYIQYNETSNIYFKWSLKYCDNCRIKKEHKALRFLPKVLRALIPKEDKKNE